MKMKRRAGSDSNSDSDSAAAMPVHPPRARGGRLRARLSRVPRGVFSSLAHRVRPRVPLHDPALAVRQRDSTPGERVRRPKRPAGGPRRVLARALADGGDDARGEKRHLTRVGSVGNGR